MADDFNRISDIGSVLNNWLSEQGIDTYAELADIDPNWIVEQFRQARKGPLALEKVQGWIEQAKLLAIMSPQNLSFTATAEGSWAEFASFYVSFQYKRPSANQGIQSQVVYRTYADHIEGNDNQQWHGVVGSDLCRWIMKHVESILNEKSAEADDIIETTNHTTEIRIKSIRVHDSMGGVATATAGEEFKGVISAHQSLSFYFNLEYLVFDDDPKVLDHAWDCKLSLYINERLGGKLVLKIEKTCQQLFPFGQTHGLEVIVIPELPSGLYRVRAIATSMTKTPVLKVINIPLLQIS